MDSGGLTVLAWTGLAFFCGALPFSLWIGRLAAGVDIRAYGDHNPGATNVLRALNWRWFALAGLLDVLKAAVPVGLAWFGAGLGGWAIVPVALAPILGHAYSPWLRGRGGKAVAATFGTWVGLTIGAGPTLLGLLLGVMFAVFRVSGWAVMFAMLAFGGFVFTYYGSWLPELFAVWLGNFLILALTHRGELGQAPGLRGWVRRLYPGSRGEDRAPDGPRPAAPR